MKLSFHDQFNLKMILIKIVVDVSSVLDILCNGFEVLKSVKSKIKWENTNIIHCIYNKYLNVNCILRIFGKTLLSIRRNVCKTYYNMYFV